MEEPATLKKTPRGIRLNNPGNIRHGRDQWQGMSADQPDESFVKFVAPVMGLRAIARVLLNYARRGFDTPAEIARRWAPPSENNTAAYAEHLALALGVHVDAEVNVDSAAVMAPLMKAIVLHENGRQPYSDALIHEAMVKAGVRDAKPKSLFKSGEFQAKAATAALACCAAVEKTADPLKQMADTIMPFTGAPIMADLSGWLLTAAGVAALATVVISIIKRHRGI